MQRSLTGVRQRVERLAVGVSKMNKCRDSHVRFKTSDVWGDTPAPAWPEQEQRLPCGTCGAPIDYRHSVDELHPGPTRAARAGSPEDLVAKLQAGRGENV